MRRTIAVWCVLGCCVWGCLALPGGIALAQEQDQAQDQSQLDEAARLTFESARQAFVAGDYEAALARFRQAYQLSARPGLLYNIAQTLDRLRRDEETVAALREYLEALPNAPNRPEVEARIRVLETAIAEREAETAAQLAEQQAQQTQTQQEQQAASGAAATTDTDAGGGIGILHPAIFISVGGLALVAGGLAIFAGLETLSLNDAYLMTNDAAAAQLAYDEASSMQTLANVFLFSAAGLGAAAVVLAVLTDWDAFGGGESDRASLRPLFMAGPNGGQLGLGGSF